MIPTVNSENEVTIQRFADKTYRVDFVNKRIVGKVDKLDAVAQAVQKIIQTERYSERIYSGDYGSEFQHLLGKSLPFVEANIWTLLNEALSVDSRIISVSIQSLERVDVDTLRVVFNVSTRYGELTSSMTLGG